MNQLSQRPPRAERTRRAMLKGARQAFLELGFEGTSILEICRRGAFSNATFYRHFETKEEAFEAIAADLRDHLAIEIERNLAAAKDAGAALEGVTRALLDVVEKDVGALQILREVELVSRESARALYGRLEAAFRGAVPSGAPAGAEALLAHLVLGAVYFNAVRAQVWDGRALSTRAVKSIALFVRRGMAARPGYRERAGAAERVEATVAGVLARLQEQALGDGPEGLSRGERTRRKVLAAALELFGEHGIAATKIGDIARHAGVALGTVYVHFESKEALVGAVVEEVGARLRAVVSAACEGAKDRRELEARAFRAFLAFARESFGIYRIVREAEFTVPAAARAYYTGIARAYAERLEEAMGRGEVNELDPLALAYALMGFGHFVGLRLVAAAGARGPGKAVSDELVDMAIALELYGAEGVVRVNNAEAQRS